MNRLCGQSFGHELTCGMAFLEVPHDGHKAAPDAWERTRNKVYKKKQQKERGLLTGQPAMTFKKGKK